MLTLPELAKGHFRRDTSLKYSRDGHQAVSHFSLTVLGLKPLTSLLKWEGNREFGYLKSIGFSVQILKIRYLASLLINFMQLLLMMVSYDCSPAQELHNWPEGKEAPRWLWITGCLADSVYCNNDSPSKFRWVIVWTGVKREKECEVPAGD